MFSGYTKSNYLCKLCKLCKKLIKKTEMTHFINKRLNFEAVVDN